MIELTGIRLTNVRAFEGETFIPTAPGLTVLIGRNNAGKSSILRAPFLFIAGNSAKKPVSTFRRAGTDVSGLGLRFKVAPEAFEHHLGFAPRRLGDVRITLPNGKSANANRMPAFDNWETSPVVELGWEFTQPGEIKRTLRCVSARSPEAYFETLTSRDLDARAYVAGAPAARVESQSSWFQGAFRTFPTRSEPDPAHPLSHHFLAHWEHDRAERVSDWIEQHTRRLVDTDEKQLQETLVFLRMKHPAQFDRISDALGRALPEFVRLDFIDVNGTGAEYRPAFVARREAGAPLARESIGSGAWTFLCVLTAARAAKVTGASVLMLDEPHLYLHPGLERLLIDELLDPDLWDRKPLQIVAATHSPTFVDAAVTHGQLNVLDWRDDARTSVLVRAVANEETEAVFNKLTSRPSDLLYSDRLVFVEGPSDVIALRVLARDRCGVKRPIRFVPLCETDAKASEVARYFSVFVQGQGLAFRTQGVLVLDADKKQKLERAWDALTVDLDPRKQGKLDVVWAGEDRENDMESVFCDVDFLVAYFGAPPLSVDETTSRPAIERELAKVKAPARSKADKGCVAIETLHETLACGAGMRKANDLEQLMHFYVANAEAPASAVPRSRLARIEEALRKLATQESSVTQDGVSSP